MQVGTIYSKTIVALIAATVGKKDFNESNIINEVKGYILHTPFYVKFAMRVSVVYFNLLSIIKKRKMMYSLHQHQISELLKECDHSFYGHILIMMIKLISTLVYFDDDTHAQKIGYSHVEHCR